MDTSRYGWFWLKGKLEFPWGWSLMDSNQSTGSAGDAKGLLHMDGLDDLVLKGLDQRGKQVKFLASQKWLSAVLGGYCSGETGQPEGEGKGCYNTQGGPRGGLGLRR